MVQKQCPLDRDVRFIEIFSRIVWLQSIAIRSSLYCPSYGGVLWRYSVSAFTEIPLYKKIHRHFFPWSLSFVCSRVSVYRRALIFRNLHCIKKFLVTRLPIWLFEGNEQLCSWYCNRVSCFFYITNKKKTATLTFYGERLLWKISIMVECFFG